MTIPSENDLNVHNSLDEITARDHFLGKDLEAAEGLFREDSMYYQEDLMWMGPRAFPFYLKAATNYLRSDYSVGDDSFVDALYNIIMFRLSEADFSLALNEANALIDYIIGNYEKFNIDVDIYGDLLGKYHELRRQLKSAT